MAQTLHLDQETTQNKQEINSRVQSEEKPNAQPGPTSSKLTGTKISTRATKLPMNKSGSTSEGVDQSSLPSNLGKFQPSKLFIIKCQTEVESVLGEIRENFHDDIKNLYNDELYADITVNIGENFKKSLHRCLLASRSYKFYTALKPFGRQEFSIEKDIIISEFQNLCQNDEQSDQRQLRGIERECNEDEVVEEPLFIACDLPDEILSPELFLNYIRRIYLDADLIEEDFKLNQQIVSWLKVHRPETISPPRVTNCSPDHRESFRTILPNFDEIPCSTGPVMSHELKNTSSFDDADETSVSNSLRDESFNGSTLTRTETFELIRSNHDSPRVCSPSKTSTVDDVDDAIPDIDKAEEVPYAPTTRTGLKPKKFTTPKDISTNLKSTPTTKDSTRSAEIKMQDEPDKVTSHQPSNRAVPASRQQPTAYKRSSQGIIKSETASDASQGKNAQPIGPKAPISSTNKNKSALITRAHPISMERSQSPGTNVLRSSGRNFIAANKRLITKTDKKVSQTNDATENNSENETSDTSSFLFESITTDSLAAHLDKLTLVSQSNLADCLSRMFITESLSDVVINTSHNKRIRAHKCILAARSAYLADLLCKQEETRNNSEQGQTTHEIDLTEYSYAAVYFASLHMYSGIVKVPDDLDLSELAELNHLLHVNTLRQVCIHNLRMNYCHFFHKPCNVCCLGVLKTLPLAWKFDYRELYSKCLQWVGSHFASIFCLKEFADLKPNDLLEECYKATLSQLTPDYIIPKTIECQKLLKNLPRVKWTEPIICLVGRLLEDFCHYVAENYEKILQSDSFHNLSKNCWECEILEENLLAAMNHLKPDSGCKTLIQLHKIECSNESFNDDRVSDSFANLVIKMRKYCERYLLKEATAVVHCSSWRHMSPSLQKRIKDQAILSTDFDEPTKQLASRPKLPSTTRNARQQLSSSPGNGASSDGGSKSPSNRSTPDSRLKSPNTYLPPPKNKTAAARHVKVLK